MTLILLKNYAYCVSDIPSRLPKLEKSSTGWYTGVIDDDDLAEIHGSERTVKNDLEETFVNSLEVSYEENVFSFTGIRIAHNLPLWSNG